MQELATISKRVVACCGANGSITANSGKHLKDLLSSGHRYLFTLIHKFNSNEEITQRENIIVVSDKAYRTNGGNLD